MKLSLRARIVTLVLITSLAVVSGSVMTVHRIMLTGYEALAAEREQSELNRITSEVTLSLQQRALALEAFARRLVNNENQLLEPQDLQLILLESSVTKSLFPDGLIVFDAQATAIAESMYVPGRLGTNYADREHFQRAQQNKTSVISEPILGRTTGLPLISFLQPMFSPTNTILGYAGGILDLSSTPLLSKDSHFLDEKGESSTLSLVIDPRYRLFVHMQKQFESPEPLPAAGLDALVDAALARVSTGSVIAHKGQDYVIATQTIEPLGWIILRAVPRQELTRPAQMAFNQFVVIAFIILVVVSLVGFWAAHRMMAPLARVTARVDNMADSARLESEFEERGSPEVKALARAINRLAAERKMVDQLKDSFVATVSHELRTPLSSLSGGIKLLEGFAAKDASEQTKKLLLLCSRNADRLTLLINDLLDFSQVTSGKVEMEFSSCGLKKIAEQATQDMIAKAQARNVGFELDIPANAQVKGDKQRLRQVLDNLLSNAIKYSPSGGNIRVVATEAKTGNWRLTVSDEGEGVPAAFAARIFQPFSQAEIGDRRSVTGTGLGLAIAKAMIENMNGTIGYYNDHGAHFWVELARTNA